MVVCNDEDQRRWAIIAQDRALSRSSRASGRRSSTLVFSHISSSPSASRVISYIERLFASPSMVFPFTLDEMNNFLSHPRLLLSRSILHNLISYYLSGSVRSVRFKESRLSVGRRRDTSRMSFTSAVVGTTAHYRCPGAVACATRRHVELWVRSSVRSGRASSADSSQAI